MSIAVEIKMQDGTVTITVGGACAKNSGDLGEVTVEHSLSETEPAGKKGGAPPATSPIGPGGGGIGGGVTVIGPIVICPSSSSSGETKGGDGGAPPATSPIGPGGAPPGTSGTSGVLVIGPIVIGGGSAGTPPPPAAVVHVPPPIE